MTDPDNKAEPQPAKCPKCGQVMDDTTFGEYPCELCGMPTLHGTPTPNDMAMGITRVLEETIRKLRAALVDSTDLLRDTRDENDEGGIAAQIADNVKVLAAAPAPLAPPQPAAAAVKMEMSFAWVVEHVESEPSRPMYFDGIGWSDPGDNAAAIRFAREKDATLFADKLDPPYRHRVREHGWDEVCTNAPVPVSPVKLETTRKDLEDSIYAFDPYPAVVGGLTYRAYKDALTAHSLAAANAELRAREEKHIALAADFIGSEYRNPGVIEMALKYAPMLREENVSLDARVEKLERFKAYVHKRLDDAGIEIDPESTHRAEGCRIGGRLDLVSAQVATLTAENERLIGNVGEWIKTAYSYERQVATLTKRNGELEADIANAVRCAKEYDPEYPWTQNTASECVWALGEGMKGTESACDKWAKEFATLTQDRDRLAGVIEKVREFRTGLHDAIARRCNAGEESMPLGDADYFDESLAEILAAPKEGEVRA